VASIDISEVKGLLKVDIVTDVKGNEVGVLKILGQSVLYAPEGVVLHPGSDYWEDMVSGLLARYLAKLLLDSGSMEGWSLQSPTGREIRNCEDWT
jgi:hypothetical protein